MNRPQLTRIVIARGRLLAAAVLGVLAAVALTLGWYGVSGQVLVAKQLPYLVSGGLVGVACVIVAAMLLGAEVVRGELARLERVEILVGELHAALLEVTSGPRPMLVAGAPADVLAVASGSTFHRPGCPLLEGKRDATPVSGEERERRQLRPCRVCDPLPVSQSA